MKKHEILWLTGMCIAAFGACCLESSGQAYIISVVIMAAGLVVTLAGFKKRAHHPGKVDALKLNQNNYNTAE